MRGDRAAKARGLGERVTQLIEQYHHGNAHDAAQRTGIPYRTLRRLAAGEIANPRADAIRALSSLYEVTSDWLLEGRGDGPRLGQDAADQATLSIEALAWRSLLRRLDLPDDLIELAEMVPLASTHALVHIPDLRERLGLPNARLDGKPMKDFHRLLRDASFSEYRLWRELVQGVVDRFGRDAAVGVLGAAVAGRGLTARDPASEADRPPIKAVGKRARP